MKFFVTSNISENISETPEGYLVCSAVSIARTGEMIYGKGETPIDPGEDGRVVIQREADEVFRPETMASFEGKSLTIAHPKDFVSPENWASLSKGIIQNVRRGEGAQESDLVADILITDSVAIQLVKSGLREVSCGYEAEYLETGIGRGIQKNIIGNHLALVSEGRAGSAYAINDHKGKGSVMKIADKIKALFAKAQDDALALVDAAPKEEPKEEKAKDDSQMGYDALCGAMKDLSSKVEALGQKGKDAFPEKKEEKKADDAFPEKKEEKADDAEVAPSLEDRLAKLEAAVAKMLEGQATGDAEEEEEVGDAEEGEEGESEDASEEKEEIKDAAIDDDTASRIEILAPGLKVNGEGVKAKALAACYATTDGKAIIERFTQGKPVDPKNEKQIDMVFIGASEVLKKERSGALAHTRTFDFKNSSLAPKDAVSAEDLNKKNESHYSGKK